MAPSAAPQTGCCEKRLRALRTDRRALGERERARKEAYRVSALTLRPSRDQWARAWALPKITGGPTRAARYALLHPLELHSTALRYPGLKFVLPHFGAGYLREALMLADLCPNVYLDTSSSNSWMRYEGLDLKTVF